MELFTVTVYYVLKQYTSTIWSIQCNFLTQKCQKSSTTSWELERHLL